MEQVAGRRRRRHTEEFKADLVAQCRQPGMSMSRVAQAHNVNANLVRRWVLERGGLQRKDGTAPSLPDPAPEFVALSLPNASAAAEICIDLQRGSTQVRVRWPADRAEACAAWLRGWLR